MSFKKHTSFFFVLLLGLLINTSVCFAVAPSSTIAAILTAIDEKTELQLSLSEDSVAVGDTFTLTLSMKSGTNAPSVQVNTLSVPGLQVFRQSSISNQTQVRSINGVSAVIAISTYQLVATQPGDYTIGPVTYQSTGTSTITSNSVVLHVTEKKTGLFNQIKKDNSSENSTTNDVHATSLSSFFSMYKEKIGTFLLWLLLIMSLGLSLFFYFKRGVKSKNVDSRTSEDAQSPKQPIKETAHSTENQENNQRASDNAFIEEEFEKLKGKHLYVYTYKRSKELLQKLQTEDGTASKNKIQALRNILEMSEQAKFAPEDQNQRQHIISLAKQINHYYEQ